MAHPAFYSRMAALALASCCAALAPSAAARPPLLAAGEVTVQAGPPELAAPLKAALQAELAQLGSQRLPARTPLVVSASLVKLSSEQHRNLSRVSVTVSVALRRARDQVLFAELRGRAMVEEASGDIASTRRSALRAALRSAVARLPEAAAKSE